MEAELASREFPAMNTRATELLKEVALAGGPEATNAMKELGSRYWSGSMGVVKDEAEVGPTSSALRVASCGVAHVDVGAQVVAEGI